MTSDTPPINSERQTRPTAPLAPDGASPGRRPWLEPALVVAALGLAVTILGLLLSIAFGIYSMNTRIDTLDANLNGRIDVLRADFNARIDALGASLNARIDALDARVDALDARVDALGSDFNIRIEQVYQLLLPEKQ